MRWPAAVAVVLLTSCTGAPRDPLDRLLADVTAAAANRDSKAIAARLSDDFTAQENLDREDVRQELQRMLAAYASVDVQTSDVQRPEAGHVVVRATFTGHTKQGLGGVLPELAVYEFDLRTTGEGDALKVRRATWREWQPAAR